MLSGAEERAGQVALIAVDWGSTRLRVSAVGADGTVGRHEATEVGILGLDRDRQAATLGAALAPLRAAYPDVPVLAAGMIGSRNGMVETTPVTVPATVADIARAMAVVTLGDGTTVRVAPGLTDRSADPVDLIRGEEVQVFGYLAGHAVDNPADSPADPAPTADAAAAVSPTVEAAAAAADTVLVLPGTHSKWVTVRGDRVIGFRTFLTGELFARLRETPSLCPPIHAGPPSHAGPDPDGTGWFREGIDLAGLDGGLLRQLFAARSRMLTNTLDSGEVGELLSGLVIATEIAGARQAGLLATGRPPVVIAGPDLARRYRAALTAAGPGADLARGDAFGRGIAAIAARLPPAEARSASPDRSRGTRSKKEPHHE